MLKLNIHPKVVQERLGHSKVSTTLDIYSHIVPGIQENAALAIDQRMDENRNGRVPKVIQEAEELVPGLGS